jgi:DHA1 family multidrug resistance protein-like MFS transporter
MFDSVRNALHAPLADLKSLTASSQILLIIVTITGITTFMLLPFLALALTAKGLSVTEAGAAIATVMLFQQGGGPIAGFVVHRLGGMWPMLAGIALRLAALVLLSTGSAFAPLITACAALGFGGALISLPIRFAFIRLPDDIRRKTLALRGTAVNFGAIVGPAVGGALISVNFATVCFLGICSHLLVLTLVVVARLGLSHTPLKQDEGESAARMSALKRTSRIAPLLFAAFAFWFGYAQLNVSVPLAARSGGASDTDIAALFVVNAVIVLSLEYPLVRSVGLKFSSRVLVLVGLGVLAIGFVVLTVSEIAIIWRGWLVIVLFSLAEIL